jgi:hypothetical protein
LRKQRCRGEAVLLGVAASLLFIFAETKHRRAVPPLLHRLPSLAGAPVRIEVVKGLRDRHGPVHAGTFLRERRIRFDCTPAEFPRIFVHELFHFVWLRAGNPVRTAFEQLLLAERQAGARGELGWSAEWRKEELTAADIRSRSRRWREYCCESFCDTAAWRLAGVGRHPEFTLKPLFRQRRRVWFRKTIETRRLSI